MKTGRFATNWVFIPDFDANPRPDTAACTRREPRMLDCYGARGRTAEFTSAERCSTARRPAMTSHSPLWAGRELTLRESGRRRWRWLPDVSDGAISDPAGHWRSASRRPDVQRCWTSPTAIRFNDLQTPTTAGRPHVGHGLRHDRRVVGRPVARQGLSTTASADLSTPSNSYGYAGVAGPTCTARSSTTDTGSRLTTQAKAAVGSSQPLSVPLARLTLIVANRARRAPHQHPVRPYAQREPRKPVSVDRCSFFIRARGPAGECGLGRHARPEGRSGSPGQGWT